ncbi:MAG: dCTP deaminase [candidate division Zixibacteria bacterium]|nr:dCTP deaminase [candidate division Zixibacteria bacterium]
MSVKPDRWIAAMARKEKMISPFAAGRKRKNLISYGLSSYGYDMRLANEFQLFTDLAGGIIDPKKLPPDAFQTVKARSILIPSGSFLLGRSLEYFRIPRSILTICLGKSTYARCGVVVNVTPFEPEWEGFATISLANTSPLPVRIYAGEGIAQVIFLESDTTCRISYADKKGKYQAQKKITGAKI